jgi:hypothetical protein
MALDALMPPGSIWRPKSGGDFDNFQEGLADSIEDVREDLDDLSEVRRPSTTTVLSDLEKEYGLTTDPNLSEAVRRMQLASKKFPKIRNGSKDHLQDALDAAGFNVQVHENSPAVDPAIFLDQAFQMVAGTTNAVAGNQDAFAGRVGGELLVNGDLIIQTPAYIMQAGGVNAFAWNAQAVAGRFDVFNQNIFQYEIPTDPNDWPLVFFVGGDAIRDGSGALTEIQLADVPNERKLEFKRTILKIKPTHSWAGLIIDYN